MNVRKGELLEGLREAQVQVENVRIRESDGRPRAPGAVDSQVEEIVARAVAGSRRALLHLLDTSKTGLIAPSVGAVERLRHRHGGEIDVVVDASQLRVDRPVVAEYLRRGYIVLITGSKFVTGPPFAGALLVPDVVAERTRGRWMLPGLAAYATRHEWPRAWAHAQAALPDARNLGLLLRWEAALWELRAFRAVPPAEAKETLARFGRAMTVTIAQRPYLTAIDGRPLERGIAGDGGWDSLPTILPFRVSRGGVPLTFDELRDMCDWLNRDVSAWLPDSATERERAVAAKCCHIGQPIVVVCDGALRIAGGARLVSGVAFDPGLGRTKEERLQREIGDAEFVFEKVDVLVRHWDALHLASLGRTGDGAPR